MRVFLRECESYDQGLLEERVRSIVEESGLSVRGARALLKPSFVYPARSPHCLAASTQPELVASVTRVLLEQGAREVLVAEDCLLGPSEVAFAGMGLRGLLGDWGTFVPLQSAPRVSVDVPDPFVQERFVVPRIWLEADLFVSLPKIKVNMFTDVTLSVKNNFGFLLERHRLRHHDRNLHRKIADLYKVRPPDLVVADSVVAGEGQGPMAPDPVWLKVLLAGRDGLAVDAVACHLIGFEPREIEHLVLLHEAGFGPLDLDQIELESPELLAKTRRSLRRAETDFDCFSPTVTVVSGTEVCCTAGCAGMIRNSLDQWRAAGTLDQLRGYTFVVGKPVGALPPHDRRRTLVVGDCAMDHAREGTFVPGCSVPPLAVVTALAAKGKLVPMRLRARDVAAGLLARLLGRDL